MKKNVMICVTDQKVCEVLITNTMKCLKDDELEIFIVHGSKVGVVSTKESREALEYLFEVAGEYGASISVLKTDNILKTLIDFTEKNEIDIIVMGETRLADVKNSIIVKMEAALKHKNVEIKVLPTI